MDGRYLMEPGTPGSGGAGGGGSGSVGLSTGAVKTSGTGGAANTGGGGGGGGTGGNKDAQLPGGSGIVIVRYRAPSPAKHFLAGNLTVTATDASAVWQWPNPDKGMLRIQRDASATHSALTVAYEWGGTAVQGVDYAASLAGTSVTLPAGVASVNITITPLLNPAGSPGRTVSLTLLPGEYAVGTPASNSVALGAYTAPASTFSSATGGTVTNYTDAGGTKWTAHTFEKSGTFSVTGCGPVDVLVVSGGGGGGYFMGGGGGGGGVIYSKSFWVFDGAYSVGIGGGGSGGTGLTGIGGRGGNSFFSDTVSGGSTFSLTANGGGGGGAGGGYNGSCLAPTSGGSGGGGSIGDTDSLDATNGAAGTPPHGYAGGNGLLTAQNAGGGGGAGGIGGSGTATTGGAGGVGREVDITGSSVCYGGGGGGGGGDGKPYGPGGLGGGGNGSVPDGQDGANSLGGGGGGASGSRFKNGGNGGSGIVIVRYRSATPTSSKPAATNNAAPANVTAPPASRAASVKPSESEIQAAQRLQGAFVWTQGDRPAEQTYAAFRKTFESDKAPSSATLRIFGDTRYVLWINGQYVSRGPCRFDPKRPEYDVLDVAKYLRRGRNVVVVLSHYYSKGDGSEYNGSARLMQHRPGLTAELELTQPDGSATRLQTDASWRCTTQTRHLPSPESYGSVYDRIDARIDSGDWNGMDFDDSNWPAAVPLAANGWEPLQVRSIPLLREVEVDNLSLVKVENTSVELGPLTNRWPLKLAAGARVVIDCGRAVQGYTVLDFEASAGSQLEVDYRVLFKETKGSDGGPNCYTARAGRQTYMSTDNYGCKYIVLTVTSGDITLRGLRVVDRLYPFERLGRFASNDKGPRGLDRIWQIGVRTVELCSEDSIVDCAERERGQWIADGFMMGYPVSRVTLAGPGKDGRPHYADGRLLKNMLRHLAFGQMPDGRIRPLRPCEYPVKDKHGVIDDYSCIWVHAVAEYYRRDADLEFVREVWPVMVKQVDYFLKRRTDRGLVYANEFFYFGNPLAYVTCEGATINAYIYRSLRDAAELGLAAGDTQNAARFAGAADQLREAYNRELWDDETGAYHAALVRTPVPPVAPDSPPSYSQGYSGPKDTNGLTPPTGHAATIALSYDLVPAERQARVLAYMQKQFPAESPFPYTFRFYLENLYRQDTDEMDRNALKTIRDGWYLMALGETGTTWERFNNGSFVHESGAHPAYFLSSYVLGVRTEGPREARQLLIDPRLGDLTSAEGTTLTEFGPVSVHWERDANLSLSFEIVNGTTVPAMLSLRLPANTSVMINGKAVLGADLGLKDGRMHFSLSPGRHGGRVKGE